MCLSLCCKGYVCEFENVRMFVFFFNMLMYRKCVCSCVTLSPERVFLFARNLGTEFQDDVFLLTEARYSMQR